MLMRLFHAACAANDRRRARATLQDCCDDRVKALRALDKAQRDADRALRDALDLEREQTRAAFFGQRDPVRTAFVSSSAALFGITEPTRIQIAVLPLAAVDPLRLARAA